MQGDVSEDQPARSIVQYDMRSARDLMGTWMYSVQMLRTQFAAQGLSYL